MKTLKLEDVPEYLEARRRMERDQKKVRNLNSGCPGDSVQAES